MWNNHINCVGDIQPAPQAGRITRDPVRRRRTLNVLTHLYYPANSVCSRLSISL